MVVQDVPPIVLEYTFTSWSVDIVVGAVNDVATNID